jgi:hypothetical protein
MTWVIGAATNFGYGVILSEVQVSFKDGTTQETVLVKNLNIDCL